MRLENYLNVLLEKKTGTILSLSTIFVFGLLSLIHLYPFQNSLAEDLNGIDDWSKYARFALDINHNGISMPSLKEEYWAPAGFLYNYFIAANFYLFGENTVPIFFIQNLLLGFSVALIYLTFRDKLSGLVSLLFLFTLFLFALIDVHKYYSFRLLSENLALFTIAAFFYCLIKGIAHNKILLKVLSPVLLGLSVLIRPNIFPFAVVMCLIIFFYNKRPKSYSSIQFVLILIASSSFLAMRNYAVCGNLTFLPTVGKSFSYELLNHPDFSPTFFLKKIIFVLGFLTPLEPEYQWRPHWTIMWVGYFTYLNYRLRENRMIELWEAASHLYIFSFFSLLLIIAPQLGSYGFRLLIPATFFVLPFSFIALDKMLKKYFVK